MNIFTKYKCVNCLGVFRKYTALYSSRLSKLIFPADISPSLFLLMSCFTVSHKWQIQCLLEKIVNLKMFAFYIPNYLHFKTFVSLALNP
uniref:Uncharacterized protein n=1 Tax=Pyxicephalus adspersus TaxID=30357 RepID=A0AAV2ZZG4_PYXAD|nr:TPA: hypothetical protein GDO54_002845 [Pyxicephalus adspersus]